MSRIRGLGLAAGLAVLVLTACTTQPPSGSSGTGSPAAGDVSVVAQDLDAPWSVTFHDGTALVSERDTARILELGADGVTREVGVINGVVPQGEGGLLGIAAHEGALYVYFTADGENRIERHELTGEPGALGLGESTTILAGLDAASYHNGGRLAFGPDGMLYATTGDAGSPDRAQNLDSLSGKILRIAPDGSVPADNPIPGSLVYSYGHRNAQGLAWDSNGQLYASEFGQSTWDELNVIQPGGNYGWPTVEGIAGRDGFIDPVQQWAPGDASPSGITIAHDTIYLANLRGQRLRQVPLADLGRSSERFTREYGRLRDVVTTPDGELWLVTNNTDGRGTPQPGDDRILRIPAS